MTDNRNRTAPELRKMFEIHGGKLGTTNSVAYLFERKGVFLISSENQDEEKIMEVAMEGGAEDIQIVGENFEVTCPPDCYTDVSDALTDASIECVSRSLTRIPTNTVDLSADEANKVLKFIDQLDDHDDVQNVSANFNIPEEVLKAMG